MPARVTLTVTNGPLAGRKYVFDEPATRIFGRHVECDVRFPDHETHQKISRRHSLVEIHPPQARVRDLDSLHGTFVNGSLIGRRPRDGEEQRSREQDLRHGDRIGLGDPRDPDILVEVAIPSYCSVCSAEIAGADRHYPEATVPALSCPQCSATDLRRLPQGPFVCRVCGGDVSNEITAQPGDYVCSACRARPESLVERLVGGAGGGTRGRRSGACPLMYQYGETVVIHTTAMRPPTTARNPVFRSSKTVHRRAVEGTRR